MDLTEGFWHEVKSRRRPTSAAKWEAIYPTNDVDYSSFGTDGTANKEEHLGRDMSENVKQFLRGIDNKRKRDAEPYFQALSTPKPKPKPLAQGLDKPLAQGMPLDKPAAF